MPYATHDTISDAFFLYDDADEPILGAVAGDFATIEAYALPHGTPTAAVTLTETGGGGYAVSFVPTTLAMWTVHVVYDVPPVFRDYSLSYLVDATGTATGVAVVGPTTTRQDLARTIGRRLRELSLLTATSDGTNVSFVDANTLRGPDQIYRGRDLYFPTTGEQRRVNNSTQATSRLTWGTAVAASTLTGARAELWNEDGQGVDRTMVNDAIDQALVYAQSNFWIPVVADVAAAFAREDGSIAIPAAITRGVSGVRYLDEEADEHLIDRAATNNGWGWSVRKGAGTIQIAGEANLGAMDTRTVRVLGYGGLPRLASDADTTNVNAEWIVVEACRLLTEGMFASNPERAVRWYPTFEREAAAKRAMAIGRIAPGTERLS